MLSSPARIHADKVAEGRRSRFDEETEHGQRFLISENPRYLPIEIESGDRFEMIGVVVGRTGSVT